MSYFLFITSDYKPSPGGIAEYIDNIARGLKGLGNETRVFVVVHPAEKERIAFLENYEEWVCPLPVVHDKKPKNWFGSKCVSALEIMRCLWPRARAVLDKSPFFRASTVSIGKLKEVIKKEKPSMIVFGHLDMKFYPFVLFLSESGLPYGVIAHDSEVYPRGQTHDAVIRGMILKRASWVAANSRHTESLLKMWGLSNEKIIVVHPPISEQAIRESARAYPKQVDGHYNLTTISRLVSSKGIDIVLRALKVLDQRGVPYRYIVAGDGPERKYLEGLAAELELGNEVRFLGYIADDEKWAILRRSDVFVMPSRVNVRDSHEGFGLAFIEAAAVGVPAVGSMAGGIPEAVLHGETGLLVMPESPECLAEALIWLYQNPEVRKEMGRTGMTRAISQFSPSAIATHFQREISKRVLTSVSVNE
jgi:glycosyltransferase involved in cell wall biosynthesis